MRLDLAALIFEVNVLWERKLGFLSLSSRIMCAKNKLKWIVKSSIIINFFLVKVPTLQLKLK